MNDNDKLKIRLKDVPKVFESLLIHSSCPDDWQKWRYVKYSSQKTVVLQCLLCFNQQIFFDRNKTADNFYPSLSRNLILCKWALVCLLPICNSCTNVVNKKQTLEIFPFHHYTDLNGVMLEANRRIFLLNNQKTNTENDQSRIIIN